MSTEAKKTVKKPKKNVHKDHRQRMRDSFHRDWGEFWYPHQKLEFLLFRTIPRRDTNPTAHNLINTFGSVNGVLKASRESLLEVEGIGPASADMLQLMGAVCERYRQERAAPKPYLADTKALRKYILGFFTQEERSGTYLLCVNTRREPSHFIRLTEDPPQKDPELFQRILLHQLLIREVKPKLVFLIEVRQDDQRTGCVHFAKELMRFLRRSGIEMHDYYIYTPNHLFSMRGAGFFRLI